MRRNYERYLYSRQFLQSPYTIPFLIWGGVLLLSFWRFYLSERMPLTPDEAYYTLWANKLQGGYYDHPYMVALWIKIGQYCASFLGYSISEPFFIRFFGVFSAVIGSYLFYDTARIFFKKTLLSLLAMGFLNSTIFYGAALIIMTPDVPQIFFVMTLLWSLAHLYEDAGEGYKRGAFFRFFWSGLLGLSLGLGGASKYTMILFVPSILGVFIFDKRKFWKKKEFYTIPLWALPPIIPVLLWNKEHHWVGLLKQGSRVTEWHLARAFQFLSELCAGQMGLMTPMICLLSFYGLWKIRKERALFIWLILPGLCVFIIHAFGDRVQANWPSLLYPALLLVGAWVGEKYQKLSFYSLGSGSLMLIMLSLQALGVGITLSAHYDPIARQMAGWEEFARNLQEKALKEGVEGLYIEDYALASILCKQPSWHLPIMSGDSRWQYFEDAVFVKSKKLLNISEMRGNHALGNRDIIARWHKKQILRLYLLQKEREGEAWRIPFCGKS